MSKKRSSSIALIATVVVVILLALLAFNGLKIGGMRYQVQSVADSVSLGLDLRGGVYAVYVADDTGEDDFSTLMDLTVSALRERLTGQGFTEATVTRQGQDRIRVEIPDVENPNEILSIIGTPAHLEFIDPEGNVVIEGADIEKAYAGLKEDSTEAVVNFELSDEGRKAFATATANNIGKVIRIVLDGKNISTPVVNSAITGGKGYIEGMKDADAALNLASLIMSGALPLDIHQDELSAVSATLGTEAIHTSLLAGLIGLILVMLFMLLMYRLPGLVADLALAIYVLIVAFALAIARVQLTLPGIAGILLGIGMAVDANVIIFERFREELHGGAALKSAVRRGFRNAITAVIDSNVTTVIAAIVLMYFGTGTIKGFAITLFISVVVSMFTAVFVTRWLLNGLVNIASGLDQKFFTRPYKERKANGTFIRRTKVFSIISAALVAAAIILTICGAGMNLGIDFTGGSLLRYELGQPYEMADVEKLIADQGITEYQAVKSGDTDEKTGLQIRLKLEDDSDEVREKLEQGLTELYPDMQHAEISAVGAVAGRDLISNAIKALLIAFACMLVYIMIRFDFFSGLAALVALAHDILIMCAFMVFFGKLFQVNSPFIAALLTIVGYSINNTIIIFDRIRESNKNSSLPKDELVDLSVSRTLGRTLNTTITTLLTLVCLFIFGVTSIREFTFPLLVGMLAGTYSSVLLSGQFWAWMQKKRSHKKA